VEWTWLQRSVTSVTEVDRIRVSLYTQTSTNRVDQLRPNVKKGFIIKLIWYHRRPIDFALFLDQCSDSVAALHQKGRV
jgi:hypothetical protein